MTNESVILHVTSIYGEPESVGIIGNYPVDFVNIIIEIGGIVNTWNHKGTMVSGWIIQKNVRSVLLTRWGELNQTRRVSV